MAGAAELFTVCRSCGQQVSTFVTECPYCGTRLRQRAPRLDRKDGDLEALLRQPSAEPDRTIRPAEERGGKDDRVVVPLKRRKTPLRSGGPRRQTPGPRRPPARTGRPRGGRLEALRGSGRPWATIVVLVLSLISVPLQGFVDVTDLVLVQGAPAWRPFTAALTYLDGTTWHALAVLTTFGVFGWLWERRAGALGALVVLVAFLVGGVGGLVADQALDAGGVSAGASGAAIALATAWIVAELRALRRKEALDGDVIGAGVLLFVPVATTAFTEIAAPTSILVGLVLGAVLGLALSAARR
jgi:hypothetical protein